MFVTGLTFFIILSILVFIHELGHFLVAKLIGVKAEEFGFGLPPRIWGKKFKGTVYSINWLPIGGFVKLAGEDEDEKEVNGLQLTVNSKRTKEYFFARSKKERSVILIAGVTMNFFLAVGLTTYLLTQGIFVPAGKVTVEKTLVNSPAEKAGILPGDIIIKIDNTELTTSETLIKTTREHLGAPIKLLINRNGKSLTVTVVPRKDFPKGEGPMGVAITDIEKKVYPLNEAPIEAVKINLTRGRDMLVSLGTTLWRLITLQPISGDVAGPIGIAQVTGQAVKYGFNAVLEFMSILSLNLAVLNILPFPALDGGRLAFVFLEKIFGHKFHPVFERSAHQIGLLILLTLIFLISIHDILRLLHGA